MNDRGITRETAERFRLGYDETSRRLTIPYLTAAGPWQIKYRCIQQHDCKDIDQHNKYINDHGTDPHLFNVSALLHTTRVLICEGELDAISAAQIDLPAVGYPGTNNWQKHWRWCFDSLEEVVVIGDGDEAGRKAARAVRDSLSSAISGDVREVIMPNGMDTNEFINTYGEGEFLAEIGWI